jgi:hypothetical protein
LSGYHIRRLSDPAYIVFRSFSCFVFLGSARRFGEGGAG